MSGNGADHTPPLCDAFFVADLDQPNDLPYLCELDADHDGLHAAPSVGRVEAKR